MGDISNMFFTCFHFHVLFPKHGFMLKLTLQGWVVIERKRSNTRLGLVMLIINNLENSGESGGFLGVARDREVIGKGESLFSSCPNSLIYTSFVFFLHARD